MTVVELCAIITLFSLVTCGFKLIN